MNTYDFDQTIYRSDSSYHFFLHCLKRHPRAVLPALAKSLRLALAYRRGHIDAKPLKESLFSYLSRLEDVERTVHEFWESHRRHLADWYLRQKKEDDLIISASPEFLLAPIARELGVRLIATRMDHRTGKIHGQNCHGEEKVRRFREAYPDAETEEFYSDSHTDAPMARLAARAFLVKKKRIRPWKHTE
ncbi:MAG: HAD-IB family phosphatase [Oscillospiraceae bacterium]|nr:HAD-IB family phosphatase [Oscillospiraceae bacterium]